MNPVFLFHVLQTDKHVCEIDKKVAPQISEAIQILGYFDGGAPKNVRIDFSLNRDQPVEVVQAKPARRSQVQNLINRFPVSKCEITIEQIKCVLKLSSLQDGIRVIAEPLQGLDDRSAALGFHADEFSNRSQIDPRYTVKRILEVMQSGKQQPLDPEPIGTELKADKFSVPLFTPFIANAHLANGVPSGNDCRSAADQGLEIVDEIAPPVAAHLTGDITCLPEKNRQQHGRGYDKPKQNQQPLLVQIGQSFPRNPYDVRNKSHVFRVCESALAGSAL
ncbi:hypothetical protein [Agrobacterium sp. 22-226-1]